MVMRKGEGHCAVTGSAREDLIMLCTSLRVALRLLLGLAACCGGASAQIIGVGTHFGFGGRDVSASMMLVSDLGVDSIRDDIFWSHVERERGKYKIPADMLAALDEAEKRGIKVLLILGYGNDLYGPRDKPLSPTMQEAYTRYVSYVVKTLKGRVWGYQVWNEWDWKTGGYPLGAVDDYLRLLRSAVPVIRQQDPGAKILSSSVTYKGLKSGWLDEALEKGLSQTVDGVAINPYVQSFGPGKDSGDALVSWVRELHAKVNATSRHPVPLYITEVGWASVGRFTRKRVAGDLEQTFKGLLGSGLVGGIWWYNLQDDGRNPGDGEHNYGLVDHDLRPKEAYSSMRALVRRIR